MVLSPLGVTFPTPLTLSDNGHMPLTKIAEAERRRSSSSAIFEEMVHRGWYEVDVSAEMLVELEIPYEVVNGQSAFSPTAKIHAPIWVFGVWHNAGAPMSAFNPRWSAVKSLLIITRDSTKEQEMLTAEMILDVSTPQAARKAASNFLEIRQGKRKSEGVGYEHS